MFNVLHLRNINSRVLFRKALDNSYSFFVYFFFLSVYLNLLVFSQQDPAAIFDNHHHHHYHYYYYYYYYYYYQSQLLAVEVRLKSKQFFWGTLSFSFVVLNYLRAEAPSF